MNYEVKELGIGGILDQAVNLLKNHFRLLFGITFALYIPWALFQNFVTLAIMPTPPAQPTLNELTAFQQVYLQALAANAKYLIPMMLFLVFIVIPITNAAIITAIASCYLGQPSDLGGSLGRAMSRMIPLLWTWFLAMLAIMGGSLLCVIPGILAAFWFSLSTHAVVLEGKSGLSALSRSKFLMRGNIGTIFVLGIILGVIQSGIMVGAGTVTQVHAAVIIQVMLAAIAMIFAAAAVVVFYFSCRCKAENFDLTLLAESVSAEPGQLDGEVADA